VSRRLPWQHFVVRLPADAGQRERAHAQLVALCVSQVIPLQVTRQQDEVLRDLCRHPALLAPPETVKFLLSTIVAARPHRSNAKKHKRILKLVSDPAARLRSVTTLQLALMSLKCGSSMTHAIIQRSAPILHRW
jgi:hypothetical protein